MDVMVKRPAGSAGQEAQKKVAQKEREVAAAGTAADGDGEGDGASGSTGRGTGTRAGSGKRPQLQQKLCSSRKERVQRAGVENHKEAAQV